MRSKYGPRNQVDHDRDNPAERFLKFIQLLTSENQISKAEIQSRLNVSDTAFYKYLRNARELFPIEMEGNLGGGAYYSIDKKSLAEYFNIKRHHTSSS
ncbi:MAG: HTH domain-containing protein [Prolixibacteraceae bacterium]|nr:HTH domain-containing protein [Prolixibacteraceae bacterium]